MSFIGTTFEEITAFVEASERYEIHEFNSGRTEVICLDCTRQTYDALIMMPRSRVEAHEREFHA